MGEHKVNEYLHWQHLTTRLNCAMTFQVELLKEYTFTLN